MAETKIVKSLQFPGTEDTYQINAIALDGLTKAQLDEQLEAIREDFNTLSSFDALRYMGTIASGTSAPGGLTPAANKGDVYKVTGKGYVMGVKVETGDMLICNADGTDAATSSNYVTVAEKWDIIQTNVDIETLMAHYHTGDVTLTKTSKNVTHQVTDSRADITATFTNGASTVNGAHGHTASGSVTLTPGGSISDTSITPEGTVKLTAPASAGTNDVTLTPSGKVENSTEKFVTSVTVSSHPDHNHAGTAKANGTAAVSGTIKSNFTPSGSLENATTVTEVVAGDTTVSKHTVNETAAGGHTPSGTVTVDNATAGGSVASHDHNVTYTKKTDEVKSDFFNTASYSGSGMDGVLTFGTAKAVTTCATYEVTEESIAPAFTGTAHKHTATFTGNAVADHTHSVSVADHDAFVPVIDVTKTAHTHKFTGTAAEVTATHNLVAAAHTHDLDINNASIADHTVTAPTADHDHDFTGNKMYVHAAFTGTPKDHKHTFTGAEATHSVTVNVDDFTGNFTGSASGNVNVSVTPNEDGAVLTDVSVANHSISTVDSATVTTGNAIQ